MTIYFFKNDSFEEKFEANRVYFHSLRMDNYGVKANQSSIIPSRFVSQLFVIFVLVETLLQACFSFSIQTQRIGTQATHFHLSKL